MSGWMEVETAKKPNSIILKLLETTSCTDTPSMTTTINNTLIQFPPEMDENWLRYELLN